ncbi:MAG: hypothetical protein EOO75_09930 [Myxococcales bacterium]|nr:MAG: hypothetical protein EOO75_09930 [Myxococcales bacterium]
MLASWPAGASPWTRRVGLLALAGAPGMVGFWGPTFALTGAMPQRPAAALLALLGWALGLIAAARAVHAEGTPTVVTPDAPGARDARLALAAVVLVLGLGPGLATGALERWALDLGSFVSPPGPAQVAQR